MKFSMCLRKDEHGKSAVELAVNGAPVRSANVERLMSNGKSLNTFAHNLAKNGYDVLVPLACRWPEGYLAIEQGDPTKTYKLKQTFIDECIGRQMGGAHRR
eukprot:GDKI01014404.1.p1 GENE.GDKI01014404.1~~GDKI01014404.1.p1  ORF type:complete len:111 (-),score=24.30 GDKI01014404.1:267-569(-)